MEKALNRCFFYLKYRLRTEREIYRYLFKNSKKYKLKKGNIFEIINQLKEKGYLDDSKFIEWFVTKRTESKPKAIFIIKSELKTFGVDNDLINNYFEENKFDELELSKKALSKSIRRFSNLDPDKRTEKEITYLVRKGFRYNIAKKAVEEFNKKD
ncbi:MAG: regulatory protein RecX [bacterium]